MQMENLLSKCHKDVLKLQCICHFGPFNSNASRVGVLWLVMESTGQSDGATTMCHHFTGSGLHNHCTSVVLCGKEEEKKYWVFYLNLWKRT